MGMAAGARSCQPRTRSCASAAGVLLYLHSEVLSFGSCPRKFRISRILRYRVTMHGALLDTAGSKFAPFASFDDGRMSGGPAAPFHYQRDRDNSIGCLAKMKGWYGHQTYRGAVYYSFPGKCKFREFHDSCTDPADTGGRCDSPDGTPRCTWRAEAAGEVRIGELNGVRDTAGEASMCSLGGSTWESAEDASKCFWNGRNDAEACSERARTLDLLFRQKYPHLPGDIPVDCDT